VPFVKEAGTIFAFYGTGIVVFFYLAAFHIRDTRYFEEEDVVVPMHIMNEKEMQGVPVAVVLEDLER